MLPVRFSKQIEWYTSTDDACTGDCFSSASIKPLRVGHANCYAAAVLQSPRLKGLRDGPSLLQIAERHAGDKELP